MEPGDEISASVKRNECTADGKGEESRVQSNAINGDSREELRFVDSKKFKMRSFDFLFENLFSREILVFIGFLKKGCNGSLTRERRIQNYKPVLMSSLDSVRRLHCMEGGVATC